VAAIASQPWTAESLERLKSLCDSTERLCPIIADLSTETGCAHAIEIARERFGTIEALINNAGIGMSAIRPDAEVRHPGIEELSTEIWDRFFAIFVRAPVMLTRLTLPLMREARFGRVVNNTTSYRIMLRVLPYGSAKAAFESMSAIWAKELESSPITINVLVPGGPTDTPMISDQSGWPREKMLRPEIMGPPIAWLVSDASADFNGQRITAARWDPSLPPAEAAKRASRPIGWPELATDAVWLTQ
jgi:NAD(P)-dependent dehydrogenase (short-subunit alcohol dehydrogenase family)